MTNNCANLVNLNDVSDLKGWLLNEKNVYIGRQKHNLERSDWANDFKVKNHGGKRAVFLYEKRLRRNKSLLSSIGQLKGKTLGCWCFPKLCHGVVLHRLAGNTLARNHCNKTTNNTNASDGEFWVKIFEKKMSSQRETNPSETGMEEEDPSLFMSSQLISNKGVKRTVYFCSVCKKTLVVTDKPLNATSATM